MMNSRGAESTPLTGASSTTIGRRMHMGGLQFWCVIGSLIITLVLSVTLLGNLIPSIWRHDGRDIMDDATDDLYRSRSVADLYDERGRFIIEDFDAKPPLSDFLPGIAGYYGKPLYAFYVNRGQGIASFGTKSKDYPIMEFNSANKAYQNTALVGFRTFIKGFRGNSKQNAFITEPFSAVNTRNRLLLAQDIAQRPRRFMYVGSNEMQIQEVDTMHAIETNVTYFILPEENFGAFVKRTTITNIDKRSSLTISMLDGLANIEPLGGELNKLLKEIGRTLEGWMGVYSPSTAENSNMPFFRLSMQPKDTAGVVVQTAGNWALSILERDQSYLLPIVYDRDQVFGEDTTLIYPAGLASKSVAEILKQPQYGAAKTSSAFAAIDQYVLGPGESVTISTFYGQAADIMDLPVIARRLVEPGFITYKLKRSNEIIEQITAGVETTSADKIFDGHVQQMFLDNSLRGGIPSILGDVDDDAKLRNVDEDERLKVYHIFSRIHGDLERDYNDFSIDPTFFSQGPGNFRDVLQNRRNDVIFNPRIGSFNIRMFLSLIQADGYNPLTVEGIVLYIEDKNVCSDIARQGVGNADGHRAQRESLTGILCSGPFRPGQLFLLMEQQHIDLIISRQEFIDMVAAAAKYSPMAVYKTGFWSDHWTYYVELIETYIAIFPDYEGRIMYDEALPYFYSPAYVKPRSGKYVLSTNFEGTGKHIRQLDATAENDTEKIAFERRYFKNETGLIDFQANWQHDVKGNVFKSAPIAKLLVLATLKFSMRDAYGMGISYEGGRPGWDDACNGLVSLLGSGMPETYELIVLIKYLLSTIYRLRRDIEVPKELYVLMQTINLEVDLLNHRETGDMVTSTVPDYLFEYWDQVSRALEKYRVQTKTTFSGSLSSIPADDLIATLESWLEQLDKGVERAETFGSYGEGDDGRSGITPTYFSYNVTSWDLTGDVNGDGHPLVNPKGMSVNNFPLFLEGPMRKLKTVGATQAKEIYDKVKVSGLRDEKLKMYLISASLKGQPLDMGRQMAFPPGWLENQSVWLHMSYKYLLGLLRQGLFDEFYSEMKAGGMLPFMDPEVYGRSLLECSSFLASSAFEDPAKHGKGYLARLSGSTAEFLSMYALMVIGPRPFFWDQESYQVRFQLLPALPRWLFDDTNKNDVVFKFKLFGSIDVTYHHNLGKKDLFRIKPNRYYVQLQDGTVFDVKNSSLPFDIAERIRRVVFVASIDVYFGE